MDFFALNPSPRARSLLLWTVFWTLTTALPATGSAPSPTSRDAPLLLVDVLEQLREAGIDTIYSSRWVTHQLVVDEVPPPGPVETRLHRLLAPFGLTANAGADGIWRIVPLPTATVEGCVTSDPGGLPVASAAIQVGDRQTVTDPTGCFRLRGLPVGRAVLHAWRPGFVAGRAEIEPAPGIVLHRDLTLRIDVETRDEIFVSTTPDEPPLGTVALDELSRGTAVSDRDLATLVARLPGGRAEAGASFGVRGEDGDRVHLVVDGIELAEPYHLRDLGRLAGAVTPTAVQEVRLHRGAPPISFGHRSGGLVELTTGTAFKRLSGRSGLADDQAELSFDGTVGEGQGRWLVGLRRGNPKIPNDIVELESHPSYSDAALKGAFALTDSQELSARFFDVRDEFFYSNAATLAASDQPIPILTTTRHSEHVGLRYFAVPAERHLLSADIVSTRMQSLRAGEEDLHLLLRPRRPRSFKLRDRRDLWRQELRLQNETHVSSRWDVLSGANLTRGSTRYGYEGFELGPADFDLVDLEQRHHGIYGQATYRPHRRLTVQLGLRWDAARSSRSRRAGLSPSDFAASGEPVPVDEPCDDDGCAPLPEPPGEPSEPLVSALAEPWSRADGDVAPRLALTLGSDHGIWRLEAARAYDYPRSHELRPGDGDWILPDVEGSDHAAIGFSRDVRVGRVAAELYHRRVEDPRPRYVNLLQSVSRIPELELDRRRLDPQASRMQGLELRFDWRRGQSAGRMTYEWSRAEDRLAGLWVPRSTDRRHQLDLRFSRPLSEHLHFSLHATAASGRPTTPFFPERLHGEDLVPALGELNSARLPRSYRLDLRLQRRVRLGAVDLAFEWGIDNVFDRREVRGFDLSALEPTEAASGLPAGLVEPSAAVPSSLPPELGLGRRFRWGMELSW